MSIAAEGPVTSPEPRGGVWPWVFRGVLALAALAAPILVFKGFTDWDFPDPQKQQRLREASRDSDQRPATETTPPVRR